MIKSLVYFLVSLIPQLVVPAALTDHILDAVTYVYWANYYLPVDTAFTCLVIFFGYQVLLYWIKFMINTIDKVF